MLLTVHRLLLTVSLILMVGCAPESRAPMLHELPAFAGEVRITAEGSKTAEEFDLSFSRRRRTAQASFDLDGRHLTLFRDEAGKVTTFEDAVERESTQAESARFALILDLFDPAAVRAIEPGAKTYHLRRGEVRYEIECLVPPGHGDGHRPR